MELRIGISGWRYAGWRGDFYPAGLAQRRELEYASRALTSIEINGSFYSLQRPSSYQRWRAETPEGFVFAVKGPRFVTHMKKLAGVDAALGNFFASGVLALGPRLGPILWQLPATFRFDATRMADFFALLPRSTTEAARLGEKHDDKLADDRVFLDVDEDRPLRHCLEVRHPSFDSAEAYELMRAQGIGCVVAYYAGKFPMLTEVTSDVVYVRLHGDTELYASGYSDEALGRWAERIGEWRAAKRDVYVYFDNDAKGYAPWDALRLIEMTQAAGSSSSHRQSCGWW
ncbi:DUF72 domain-containing protein [Rhodococcus sp. BP-349]|uniref:DUF72 domain-containing protein n=1 Tax=unclassified Rhodococcus (in: high G+C Gram-positive bacteria) TaxID=192944 RepID=UPI001C9AA327|nr:MULTISPECIES: DUF72 domain-containing protein [unclassified Rhodococcus (in: high G+C Gram-positive bacteria)]MBY6537503.1 DUF72 domain-containing protein [Rhodococcus sp. BP-363]MBY6541840.1 DUF72 domain-containing protein [Rhodococcus sp. BP-369]MBY6561070.1 DUF72 domain-containing protein [Rhodococcus sp. BP-370]MBY6575362.1 DUF72 domain-containing protein [Rhodococcus sp. BP-364]MBY6584663.1 DUF72 domain-containing protein [Rhodococcus sp. BP-358]